MIEKLRKERRRMLENLSEIRLREFEDVGVTRVGFERRAESERGRGREVG